MTFAAATISYVVQNNDGARSCLATVYVTVDEVNAPVAVEDEATPQPDMPLDIHVMFNGFDPDGLIVSSAIKILSDPGRSSVRLPPSDIIT
jgi:hypothetical protein